MILIWKEPFSWFYFYLKVTCRIHAIVTIKKYQNLKRYKIKNNHIFLIDRVWQGTTDLLVLKQNVLFYVYDLFSDSYQAYLYLLFSASFVYIYSWRARLFRMHFSNKRDISLNYYRERIWLQIQWVESLKYGCENRRIRL